MKPVLEFNCDRTANELEHNKIDNVHTAGSAQPAQPHSLISLCSPHYEALGPWLPIVWIVKFDQTADSQADLSLYWVHVILQVLICCGTKFH